MYTPANRTKWRSPYVLSHQQNQVEVIICAFTLNQVKGTLCAFTLTEPSGDHPMCTPLPLTEPSGGHLVYTPTNRTKWRSPYVHSH